MMTSPPRISWASHRLGAALLALVAIHPVHAEAAAATPTQTLQRAIAAMGGAALQGWQTLRIEGTTVFYDPEQSPVPGGEPRRGAEAEFTQWRELEAERSRTDWRSRAMRPVERRLAYTEVIDGANGSVKGLDSMLPVRSTRLTGEHRMSVMRVTSNRRDLAMTSPKLLAMLLEAAQQGTAVRVADDLVIGTRRLPSLVHAGAFGAMRLAFDPATGLPERIRVLDYDPIQADSDFDLSLSDWRSVSGVLYPFKQVYTINDKLVADTAIRTVEANPTLPDQAFVLAGAADDLAATPRTVPEGQGQWTLRKQGFGVLVDSDDVVWDPAVARGMMVTPLGPSVWFISGGFYNTLLVELADSLVVYDAPSEVASQWVLQDARKRFPGKPIKHVILTHHHMDHAGGLRSYVAQGAAVVVGKGLSNHLHQALRRPTTMGIAPLRGPGVAEALASARIVEIDAPFSLGEGDVKAQAYPVEANGHAQAMLFGYVPGARLGFVSDLWSPGRGALPPVGSETHGFLMALVRSVERWQLEPERFAGGHGSVGDYAPAKQLFESSAK